MDSADPTIGEMARVVRQKRKTRAILDSQAAEASTPEPMQQLPAEHDCDDPNVETRTKRRNDRAAGKRKAAADPVEEECEQEGRRGKRKAANKKPLIKQRGDDEEDETESEDNVGAKNSWRTRMSPKLMFDFVQRLSVEQQEAVRQIGFGGLLHLKITNSFGELMKYLIDQFDVYRCAVKLQEDELVIEEDDIQCTLGIPRGPKPVKEATKYEDKKEESATSKYADLLTLWRQRWGVVSGSPVTTAMPDEIVKRGDHGDMFKRDFVVFVVSAMLRGHQNRCCNFRILNSLINVGEIKEYNWCAYTYQYLVESIDSFKKNPRRFFTGPVAFLLLVYFDRVQFRGMRVERTFPTLIGWTSSLAKKRVAAEKKAGGFGKGKVISRIEKPAADAATTTGQNVDAPAPAATEPIVTVPPSSVDRVAQVLQKLASAVVEFGEVMADIGKQGAPIDVMRRTFSGISNMLNVASTIETPSTPTPSQLDDIFYGRETFTAAVDALVEAFDKTRRQMDPDAPSFDLGLTPTPPPSQQPQQHLDAGVDAGQPDFDALVDRIGRDAGVSSSNPTEQTPAVIRVPFARATSPPTSVDEFDR